MFNKESFVGFSPGKKLTDYYEMKAELGSGSYGKVFQVIHKETKVSRACKQLSIVQIKNYEQFKLEISILAKMDHPNIIKLFEVFDDKRHVYLVMEEATGGELFDKIIDKLQNDNIFTEREAAKIFKQMVSAICYCHKEGICHRDLKPENLLLANKKDDSEIKVIDFGLSNIFKDKQTGTETQMTTKVGTAYYVSPEVLKGKYDEKCDIWSAGVILYILICGDPPFNGSNDNEIYKKIKKKVFHFTNPIWKNISEHCKDLIRHMLSEPDHRPTAEEVLANVWVKELAPNSSEAILKLSSSNLKKYSHTSKISKAVMTFICSRMKDEEVKGLKDIFIALDTNGDGHLSFEEVKNGLAKIGYEKKNVEELFKNMDTDKSGMIDYTEFLASTMQKKIAFKEDKLADAFKAFDKDNSGKISVKEIHTVLNLSEKDDKEQIKQIVEKYDINHDGEIDQDEFINMMSNLDI
jgi:calcium-dependent protein kinase